MHPLAMVWWWRTRVEMWFGGRVWLVAFSCCFADNNVTFQYLSELLCPFHEIIGMTCY